MCYFPDHSYLFRGEPGEGGQVRADGLVGLHQHVEEHAAEAVDHADLSHRAVVVLGARGHTLHVDGKHHVVVVGGHLGWFMGEW